MGRTSQVGYALFFAAIITAAAFCVAAEFKKSKKYDLRFDGNLCYLPKTDAFRLGIAALICLLMGQTLGSLFFCRRFRSESRGGHRTAVKPSVSCGLVVFSWVSFGVAVILISSATSMSRSQAYGEGWLDGECYLVKDGVFVASAALALLSMISTLAASIATNSKSRKNNNNNSIDRNNNNSYSLEGHTTK